MEHYNFQDKIVGSNLDRDVIYFTAGSPSWSDPQHPNSKQTYHHGWERWGALKLCLKMIMIGPRLSQTAVYYSYLSRDTAYIYLASSLWSQVHCRNEMRSDLDNCVYHATKLVRAEVMTFLSFLTFWQILTESATDLSKPINLYTLPAPTESSWLLTSSNLPERWRGRGPHSMLVCWLLLNADWKGGHQTHNRNGLLPLHLFVCFCN